MPGVTHYIVTRRQQPTEYGKTYVAYEKNYISVYENNILCHNFFIYSLLSKSICKWLIWGLDDAA